MFFILYLVNKESCSKYDQLSFIRLYLPNFCLFDKLRHAIQSPPLTKPLYLPIYLYNGISFSIEMIGGAILWSLTTSTRVGMPVFLSIYIRWVYDIT